MRLLSMFLRFFWVAAAIAFAAFAGVFAAANEQRIDPLLPEDAFVISGAVEDGQAVVVWQMPEDIYLYQNRIALTATHAAVRLATPTLPPGEELEDPFFGKSTVYFDAVTVRAAIQTRTAVEQFALIAHSQGCDKQIGICYPPLQQTLTLAYAGNAAGGASSHVGAQDESSALSQLIASRNIFFVMGVFFLLGVGLSLTPCVLPMLPILFGVIGRAADGGSTDTGASDRRRIIARTACYIAGTISAFTALGIAAGFSGQLLSAAIQKPIILISFAIVLAALAVALFCGYNFQLPAFLRQRFASSSPAASRHGNLGAFVMGVTATTIASPCVAPPLIGALLYIGSTGDALTGALTLFSLGAGMSVLLAAAGIGGGALLPKAGQWMDGINRFFAVLLLITAVWIASPLLSSTLQLFAYGGLLIFAGVLASPFAAPAANAPRVVYVVKAGALALVVWGAVMLVGASGGSRDVLTPLSVFAGGASSVTAGDAAHSALEFENVEDLATLQEILADAQQPVLVEFYADWCVSCKEFERFTLSDARVQARLQPARLLRVDVTEHNEADRALLAHFNLFGPPALLFWTASGEPLPHLRLIGFEPADKFLTRLTTAGF